MPSPPTIILLDNGSMRPASTLSLRRIAEALEERIGRRVHPVSLLHADRVPAESLDDRPADTFEPFLRTKAKTGDRQFLVLPLFFGPSRALTELIPAKTALVSVEVGPVNVRVTDVLCPLPAGEPLLTSILEENIARCASDLGISPERLVLVDHGSPIPEVTAVRIRLATDLRARVGTDVRIGEAVMERRTGPEYDFNGHLLADVLQRLAKENREKPVILSMLFLFPGRHAGPGGDIEQICRALEQKNPGFRVHQTALVGDHPALVDILQARVESADDRGESLHHPE